MNYQYHYDKLIETRKLRIPELGKYYERHHIIMRSMGGSDDDSNLVKLTAREHLIAHWLLWRIHRNRSSALAFHAMCKVHPSGRKDLPVYRSVSRAYEEARLAFIEKQTGAPNKGALKTNTRIHTCPHCKRQGKGNVFVRWHFDYCRSLENPIVDPNRESIGRFLASKNREPLTCPHCKRSGLGIAFKRYHFDKCRTIGGTPKMNPDTPERRERWQKALAKANSREYVCPNCNKEGKGNWFKGHHFEKCKTKASI